MAEPLPQRIHAEIRVRLRDAELAVHEYSRLETALAALDGVAATGPRSGRTPTPTPRQPLAPVGEPRPAALRLVCGRHAAPTALPCCACSTNVRA